MNPLVQIGSISSPHGLDGSFKASLRLQDSLLEKNTKIFIGQDRRFAFLAFVKSYKLIQDEALIKILNFTHIDHVSLFMNAPIWCDKALLPEDSDVHLLDKRVLDEKQNLIGTIESTSFADVRKFLHIINTEGKILRAPLQDAYFKNVDLDKDHMIFHDYELFKDLWE